MPFCQFVTFLLPKKDVFPDHLVYNIWVRKKNENFNHSYLRIFCTAGV
jgi:hypothetical protein